jgi:hypothetical protein
MLSAAMLVFGLCCITADLTLRALLLSVTLASFVYFAWFQILKSEERHLVKKKLRKLSFAAAEE